MPLASVAAQRTSAGTLPELIVVALRRVASGRSENDGGVESTGTEFPVCRNARCSWSRPPMRVKSPPTARPADVSARAKTPRSLFTLGAQLVSSAPLDGSKAAMWLRTIGFVQFVPGSQMFWKWPPATTSPSEMPTACTLPSKPTCQLVPPVGVKRSKRLLKWPTYTDPSPPAVIETTAEFG